MKTIGLYRCVYNAVVSLCLKYKNKGEVMYYNTTQEVGVQLKANLEKANNQTYLTLAVFQTYPKDYLSAHEVWTFLMDNESIDQQTPITSIRRAITDLTNQDRLVKTDKKVLGGAGRKTYTWRLK
tara:strand:+ start:187 stop:561 length:375 start_codon:yes stop_codon:yes gene_type:complete